MCEDLINALKWEINCFLKVQAAADWEWEENDIKPRVDEIRRVLAKNELEVATNTQRKKKKSYKYTRNILEEIKL